MDRIRVSPRLWLLFSFLAVLIAWVYMARVLVPWEQYFNVEAGTMKAALGDLYSPWFGTRALLIDGKNPYGPEVADEIQMAFYGHDVVQPDQPGVRVVDEQRFAYPVYVVFLLAPLVWLKFAPLHGAAPLVLAPVALITVRLWMAVLRWQPASRFWATALFVLASPQIAQGLRLRQLGLIVGCLLALSTWLVVRNHLALSGVVLALATIKPQMIVLPLAWFLLWSMGDLRKRWHLPAGFAGALVLLAGAGELILPGWLPDFLAGLVAYRKYGPIRTLLQLALGDRLGMAAAVVLIAVLLIWGWMHRRDGADSQEFAFTLSAFLLGSALALPLMPPFNQVLLILPLLIILRDWSRLPLFGRVAFVVCAGWPWMVSLVLLASRVPLRSLRPVPLLPSALALFFPVLLTLLFMARRSSPLQNS
jgi:hypothetical protein